MLQNLRWQAKESATGSAWRWIALSWLAVGIGSVYILAARLSLSLLTPDGVAVFWPAAGVAAGAPIAFWAPARGGGGGRGEGAAILGQLPWGRKPLCSLFFFPLPAGGAFLVGLLCCP